MILCKKPETVISDHQDAKHDLINFNNLVKKREKKKGVKADGSDRENAWWKKKQEAEKEQIVVKWEDQVTWIHI